MRRRAQLLLLPRLLEAVAGAELASLDRSVVLEVDENAQVALQVPSLGVLDVNVVIVDADSSLRRLLQWRGQDLAQRDQRLPYLCLLAVLNLVNEPHSERILVQYREQLLLGGHEVKGGEAVPQFCILALALPDWRWRGRLECVHLLELHLVGGKHVRGHSHVPDAQQVNRELEAMRLFGVSLRALRLAIGAALS